MIKQLDQLIVDRADDGNVKIIDRVKAVKPYSVPKKQIFASPPHFTADNHFSGDHVMDYVSLQGYGITCTTCQDRLPMELKKYLHHGKKDSNDARMKVMLFENPICVTKYVAATLGIVPVYWINQYFWCEQSPVIEIVCGKEES